MLGETISHYEILEKLGEGGMGVVYRARDTKLDRTVAIKFLPPHLSSDPVAVKRFVHEAKTASALNHSAIGVIHEIDETDDGQTFIVMALYEGGTLREQIDISSMTTDEAVAIASQIASGLARAHEKGIVHRDIKPQNILLTRDGEAKIIDFGLAKLAGRTKLTRDGSTLGTAAYMSPEQARGEEVDHRSDIFSLGTIFYEMLAGEPPFKGEHEAALLYGIVHEEPEPVSEKCGDIDAELCGVIDKALKKDANERYQSVEEMKADLMAVSEGSGSAVKSLARPRTPSDRRWIAVVACVVIVAIISVFVIKGRFGTDSVQTDELSLAVIEFRDLSGSDDNRLAKSLTSLLNKGLIEPCPIRVVSEEMVQYSKRKVFGESDGPIEAHQAIEIAERSKAVYFISGEISDIEGKRFAAWSLVDVRTGDNVTGGTSRGEDLFVIADGIIDESLDALNEIAGDGQSPVVRSVTEVTTDVPEAYDDYVAGIESLVLAEFEKATDHLNSAVGLDSTFALAHYALSKVYKLGMSGGSGLDRKYADMAWNHRSRMSLKDRLRLEVWRSCFIYRNISHDEMRSACEQILKQWPDDLDTYRDITRYEHYQWNFSAATRYAERGLDYYPDDYELRDGFVEGLLMSEDTERALRESWKNVDLFPDDKGTWNILGKSYLIVAKPDSADWAFNKALEIDPDYYPPLLGLIYSRYHRGEVDRAIDMMERLLSGDRLERIIRRRRLMVMERDPSLPMLYAEIGRYEDALKAFGRADSLAEPSIDHIMDWHRCLLLRTAGRGEEILKISRKYIEGDDVTRSQRLFGILERAITLVDLDSLESAESAVDELHRELDTVVQSYSEVRLVYLEAQMDIMRGNPDAAITRLEERGIHWNMTMTAIHHMEILAEAYEAGGNLSSAAEFHEGILRVFGGHALSHYELGRLYEDMNIPEDAISHYEKFLEMWKNTDEGLPQPEYAKQRLAALRGI